MIKQRRHFRRHSISTLDRVYLRQITSSGLHAGFPSPATDYEQSRINLTKELVPNPDYTEIVEVVGDCCIDRHITEGCKVLVDYTMLPEHDCLVYVRVDDMDMIRVYCVEGGMVLLKPANAARPDYKPIRPSQCEHVEIRGVVIQILINPMPRKRRVMP